jgi:hypothetical protein
MREHLIPNRNKYFEIFKIMDILISPIVNLINSLNSFRFTYIYFYDFLNEFIYF